MVRYFAVRDRDDGQRYAVAALTDQLDPGRSRIYAWVANLTTWVRDDALLQDFRTRTLDQMNVFEEITADEAAHMARRDPPITARWVLARYKDQPERLSSLDLGLPLDVVDTPRPTSNPQVREAIQRAPLGQWVQVRRFAPDKRIAAYTWVSEIRLGRKKSLASLGPLEARVIPLKDGLAAQVRRALTGQAVIDLARSIAERAHGLQLDKAGQPYIDHPRRVADRIAQAGGEATTIAAGWLHDVLEDTTMTADDLAAVGIPLETITAVEAVTKRAGESLETYAERVRALPAAVQVKRADLADNTDPDRMAALDEMTQQRLRKKYARMSELLDAAPNPNHAKAF